MRIDPLAFRSQATASFIFATVFKKIIHTKGSVLPSYSCKKLVELVLSPLVVTKPKNIKTAVVNKISTCVFRA